MPPALHHARDDAGCLEPLQVLRDRRLRDPEAAGRLGDGGRARGEVLDDAPADRMGKRSERIVNHCVNNLTHEATGLRNPGEAPPATAAAVSIARGLSEAGGYDR